RAVKVSCGYMLAASAGTVSTASGITRPTVKALAAGALEPVISAKSIDLDVGVADNLRPFGDLGLDAVAELVGQACHRAERQRRELLLYFHCRRHLFDLSVELVDDRARRAGRRHDARDGVAFETLDATFGGARHIG